MKNRYLTVLLAASCSLLQSQAGASDWNPVSVQQITPEHTLTGWSPPRLLISQDGNTLVSGYSGLPGASLMRIGSDGQVLGTSFFSGVTNEAKALAYDLETNAFLATLWSGGYRIYKFSPTGTILWTNLVSSPFSHPSLDPVRLLTDQSGNIYFTGNTISNIVQNGTASVTNYNISVVSYAPDGTLRWRTDLGGSGFRQAHDMAVSSNGSIFVSGESVTFADPQAPVDRLEIYTLDATDGSPTTIYTGLSGNTTNTRKANHRSKLILTPAGRLAAGLSRQSSMGSHGLVVQFTELNAVQWTGPLVTNLSAYQEVKSIATDSAGNIYALSSFMTNFSSARILALQKFDSTGAGVWQTSYQTLPSSIETPVAMTVDSLGTIFVAGTTELSGNKSWKALKFLSDGSIALAGAYGSSTNTYFTPLAVRLDACDRFVVAGRVPDGLGVGFDVLTLKYPHSPVAISSDPIVGKATLSFTGQPGSSVVVQTSSDLNIWSDIASVPVDETGAGKFEVTPSAQQQFFRCGCGE